MRYTFDEHGNVLYRCLICHDQGWLHPVDDKGKPIYSKVKRCQCQAQVQPQPEEVQQAEMEYESTIRKSRKGR